MRLTTKDDLIRKITTEFRKLTRALDRVSEENSKRRLGAGGTIRQQVGERAHWIGLFLGWIEASHKGEDVETPAPGYRWTDLPSYNSKVHLEQADLTWVECRQMLLDRHEALLAFLNATPETQLFTKKAFPWTSSWTLARWAESVSLHPYGALARAVSEANQRGEAV